MEKHCRRRRMRRSAFNSDAADGRRDAPDVQPSLGDASRARQQQLQTTSRDSRPDRRDPPDLPEHPELRATKLLFSYTSVKLMCECVIVTL
ncbi:unnamed protein product [Acanthoscelides obtectus]|uniref:Uncharacterized protein n=1 Tax=Acanthoscelides obtectus TaxID=200917 RepID=A0A9P0K7H7_ACAOB|nr:unnamed protein product [Acanthoscelides obtectus]CAK1667439.1 hypothetical protein AOBTE_LOCUS25845 [Acanthoscelides obtectus]